MTCDDIDLITLHGSFEDGNGLVTEDSFPQLRRHLLNVVLVQVQFLADLSVRQVQAHEIQTQDPGAQGLVMTFKDRPRQVVKAPPTGLAAVPLAIFLGLIATELDDTLVPTMRTQNTLRPAQAPYNFETLGIVDEILNLHQPSAGCALHWHASFSQVFFPRRAYGIA